MRYAFLTIAAALLVCGCAAHQAGPQGDGSLSGVITLLPSHTASEQETLLRKALADDVAIGNEWGVATDLVNLAAVYQAAKNAEIALRLYFKALAISDAGGYRSGVLRSLSGITETYFAAGDSRFGSYGRQLSAAIGTPRNPEESTYLIIGLFYVVSGDYMAGRPVQVATLDQLLSVAEDARLTPAAQVYALSAAATFYATAGAASKMFAAIERAHRAVPDGEISLTLDIDWSLLRGLLVLRRYGEAVYVADHLLPVAVAIEYSRLESLREAWAYARKSCRELVGCTPMAPDYTR